jgi:cell fate (sporulation/competence/biofilm development) regulator YmcA (YheA/YmcA/DUF963 family)
MNMKKMLKREILDSIKSAIGDFEKMVEYVDSLDTEYYYNRTDVNEFLQYILDNMDNNKTKVRKKINKILEQ